MEEKPVKTTLAAFAFATTLGVIACQSAQALPIDSGAIQQAATAASTVQQAQYAERRHRGTITKCYREFVVGN
jgi:hypothetical protein